MSRKFQAALTKLIDDGHYRKQVTKDPQLSSAILN